MEATQHIVKLGPVAVEVVDRTLIELARDIAMFRPVMETYVRGEPDALLLVEFAEDDQAENLRRLDRLDELMGDLGHPEQRGEGGGCGRPAGGVGGARLRPQHHDVDEERGKARLLHRGLRGAAGAPRRLHRAPHRHLRQARHARAPGTRTPPSAACTCAPCSTSSWRKTPTPCAPSPRRRSPWSRPTRARTRASTATAWCAPSSTRRCMAPRPCACSRR